MSVRFSSGSPINTAGSNFIFNPNAEINTAFWNLYDDSGRTVPASILDQDITYIAVALGDAGNGINIDYIFHPTQSYLTPLVTVVSPTHITVAWYNGPTIANNPTATQLKVAWDAVPGAVAIATTSITGIASNRQYINGSKLLANGGDTCPTDGIGGTVTGVALTRNTIIPLVGIADFDLSKDASSREGMGVSTDFTIDNRDKGNLIEIRFSYSGSSGMTLGGNSDVRVWIYDITNAQLIQIIPLYTVKGPTSADLNFIGTFLASPTGINYRLIIHIGTTSAASWNFYFDAVVATDVISPGAVSSAPALVLGFEPVSGTVTDHMCVMWRDGATQWVPATITGAAIPVYGTDITQLGFATNIVSGTADIYIRGEMDGFSFGPFIGYNQYIDNVAGGISPLPSPFTDLYVRVGKAISSTVLNIQVDTHVDLIANGSGAPLKGGLLSNNAINDGSGDKILSVGANGNALIANSAASLGINWAAAVVCSAPLTYTLATRTLTIAVATNSVAGVLSAADHTTYSGYAATIALKAPLASPVFTGDVNISTGNLLISTVGKGLNVKTGTNAKVGTAVLVAGTVMVTNTSVTANSRIFLTSQVDGGTPGFLRITAKTVATSFVITSSNAADTSTVAWVIIESIP